MYLKKNKTIQKLIIIVVLISVIISAIYAYFYFGILHRNMAKRIDMGVNQNGDPICLEYDGKCYAMLSGTNKDRYLVNTSVTSSPIMIFEGSIKKSLDEHIYVQPFIGTEQKFLWTNSGIDSTKNMITYFNDETFYAAELVLPVPSIDTISSIETIVFVEETTGEQRKEHIYSDIADIKALLSLYDTKGLSWWWNTAEENGAWPVGLVRIFATFKEYPYLSYFIGAYYLSDDSSLDLLIDSAGAGNEFHPDASLSKYTQHAYSQFRAS